MKIIDEALEFELCRVSDTAVDGDERMMAFEQRNVHLLSKKEDEEEIEELAAKCYESGSECDVPIKFLRGVKKKQTSVVLERTTRSNKPY